MSQGLILNLFRYMTDNDICHFQTLGLSLICGIISTTPNKCKKKKKKLCTWLPRDNSVSEELGIKYDTSYKKINNN